MRAIRAGEVKPQLPDLMTAAEHGGPTATADASAVIARICSARASRAAVSRTDLLSARDEGRKP